MEPFSPYYSRHFDLQFQNVAKDELQRLILLASQCTLPILEAMCGSGRILVPLRRQIPVEGLDLCPYMLEKCKTKLLQENLHTTLHCQSMEALHLPKKYGMIFILDKSLSLITKESLATVFEKIFQSLLPGGLFVFDLWGTLQQEFPNKLKEKNQFADFIAEEDFAFDFAKQLFHHSIRYRSRDGKLLAQDHYQKQLYDKREVIALLEKAGFEIVNECDRSHFAKFEDVLFLKGAYWLESKKPAYL